MVPPRKRRRPKRKAPAEVATLAGAMQKEDGGGRRVDQQDNSYPDNSQELRGRVWTVSADLVVIAFAAANRVVS